MAAYRIYTISTEGRIYGPPRLIDCVNDEAVLKEARQFLNGEALEVWDEKRRVGRLEPH